MKSKFLSAAVCCLMALSAVILSGCCTGEPLSLWNDEAPAKNALTDYVRTVTDKGSPASSMPTPSTPPMSPGVATF